MTADPWQLMVNSLRMRLRSESTLADVVVDKVADEILASPFGGRSVQDNLAAIWSAAQSIGPLPDLVPSEHPDTELRTFLFRLACRIEDLRPWPVPAYRALPLPAELNLAELFPIARVTAHQLSTQNHLGELFRDRNVNGAERGILIIALATGEIITLVGPADLQEPDILVLSNRPDIANETLTRFQAATELPSDQLQAIAQNRPADRLGGRRLG